MWGFPHYNGFLFTPGSTCSKSCIPEGTQPGLKKRKRECIPPKNGGDPCEGQDEEEATCPVKDGILINCPVDHSFSEWSEFSECSAECGDGIRERTRTCIQGKHGGTQCPTESEKQEENCRVKDCSLDCLTDPESDECKQLSGCCSVTFTTSTCFYKPKSFFNI